MNKTFRFSVAISFPGEKREYVRLVDEALTKLYKPDEVFFDERFEALIAGFDAELVLQNIYHEQAELIVLFLCKEYEQKEWCCNVEWRAIRDLIKKRRGRSILPLRFDNTDIPGIFSIDICPYINNRTPEQIAKLIYDRLTILRDENTYLPGDSSDNKIKDDVSALLKEYSLTMKAELSIWKGLGLSHSIQIENMYISRTINTDSKLKPIFTENTFVENLLNKKIRNRIILKGFAGSGKSTLLKHWALSFADSVLLDGTLQSKFPVYCNLSDLRNFDIVPDNISTFIGSLLKTYCSARTVDTLIATPLMSQLLQNNLIFLFDGFDEIPVDKVALFTDILNKISFTFVDDSILITSRPNGSHLSNLMSFDEYALDSFDFDQRSFFIEKWFLDNTDSAQKLKKFILPIERFDDPFVLGNPLFLTMMCVNYEQNNIVITSPGMLFKQFTTLLLEYWDVEKKLFAAKKSNTHTFPLILKINILECISIYFYDKGERSFLLDDVVSIVSDVMVNSGFQQRDTHSILSEIVDRSGILILNRFGYYKFCHPLFQEFFYSHAKYKIFLKLKSHDQSIKKLFWNEKYSNVVRFYNELISGHEQLQSE